MNGSGDLSRDIIGAKPDSEFFPHFHKQMLKDGFNCLQVFRPGSYKYLLCLPPVYWPDIDIHRQTLTRHSYILQYCNIVKKYGVFNACLVRLILGNVLENGDVVLVTVKKLYILEPRLDYIYK